MRFATRKEVNLPEGVTVEGIRNRINLTLSNQGHIRGTAPYVHAGHVRSEIGCIFLTLSAHTMEELGNRLDKARVDVLRELKLPEFEFQENRENVKIFVTGVPLADTGRGSVWRVESWTSDATFDGLRSDLEGSNNGIITAARPDIMGSVHAMRQTNTTTCGIRFVVEENDAARMALSTGNVWLRGGP